MSLNGLDDAAVTEAYQGALAEGGGWFLLKYVERDAVTVLARGTGGASETRAAVAQYDEKSPLYGFLLYRRRKVLIKYTPEGTSRLLQARVAVHFTAVSEKFTPHDTTLTINSADELSDSALASACSLHTAAPSSCSSNSSSRRKLDEITEDAEEGPVNLYDIIAPLRPGTSASQKAALTGTTANGASPAPRSQEPPQLPPVDALESLIPAPLTRSRTAEEPRSAFAREILDSQNSERSASESHASSSQFRESLNAYDDLFKNGPAPRLSSQTARPAMSDLYAELYAQYKPKVKLGPRPKVSLDSKRPHTSGTGTQNAARPVSSLPAGMRVANKRTIEPKRPKSRDSSIVPSIAFPPAPPVPQMPELSYLSSMHPPKSPASVRSMTLPNHKSNGPTPEKLRLMKALELRKKQMKAQQEKTTEKPAVASGTLDRDVKITAITTVVNFDPVPSPLEEKTGEKKSHDSDSSKRQSEDSELEPAVALEDSDTLPAEDRGISIIENTITEINMVEKALKEQASAPAETWDTHQVPEVVVDRSSPKVVSSNQNDIKTPHLTEEEMSSSSISRETDDQHSAISASSPTTAQTLGSTGSPSTRPSSISEDDNLAEHPQKSKDFNETALRQLEKPADFSRDETGEDSTESSPTVVPESSAHTSFVDHALQPEPLAPALSREEVQFRKSKRESMILMPPTDDTRSRRKSNRESTVYSPTLETSEAAEVAEVPAETEKTEPVISTESNRGSYVEGKKKRAMVDPIQIHLNSETSEAEYLSDDSFMDELQSAKLEEAKPISVSKSPINSYFPRKASMSEVSMSERSVSQQSKAGRLSPEQQPTNGRKISGVWPPPVITENVTVTKKINVSSGISQRIKALAEKSNNRDSAASVSSLATPDAPASFVAQRKSSFFSTPPGGNSPPGKHVNRLSRASFANLNTSAPDRQPTSQSTPPTRDGPPVYNVKQTTEKPESVQVTARIIRDHQPLRPSLTMPNEVTPLELQQSQIIIDHQKAAPPKINTRSPVKTSPPRLEPSSPRPASSSHSKEQGAIALPRSSSESSWRSFGRRLSETKSNSGPPRSLSTHSTDSVEDRKDDKKEKKDSRASKLFKRMSSISSISSRKDRVSQQTLQEEESPLPSLREPPPPVQIGDLNVQFPDTLLWKRRWVEIDAAGNLVLSLSKPSEQSKGLTKRFHMSEFRTPFAPDHDRQELPNSIVFDFVDGRTLQCACETYMAQIQVLQIFRDSHNAWTAYNQTQ